MFRNLMQSLRLLWDEHQPQIWRNMKPSYRWAASIAMLAALWIASGFLTGTSSRASDSAKEIKADTTPRVQTALLIASERNATVTVQGRTQALHAVDVKSEVEGVVQTLHFEKGDRVKKGDVLCEIKLNDRLARLDQARALVAQTDKQHEVDLKLAADGFRSKTQVAQSEASLEAARASLRTMQIEVDNTKMRAPFDGFVDDRYVDVGDYMRVGDKCALIIAPEPFLAVGTVTEEEVGEIRIGDPATATLVTGETVKGKVRFVADKSDDVTRAFRVEVELPNADNKLRDGVSADIRIPVRQLRAQKISPGILVLDDSGTVGVRIVRQGIVHFVPVKIVSDGPSGMWVSGLPDRVEVITVGQEFVNDGEHVQAVRGKGGAAS
jgi:multidrug efflux system membrane fusion protein